MAEQNNINTVPINPFVPIDGNIKKNLPVFPVDAMPDTLQPYIKSVAESFQVHPDMVAIAVLGVESTCVSGKYKVIIANDWIESVNLYLLEVAAPSEKKSPVISEITKPMYEAQKSVNATRIDEIRKTSNRKKILQAQIKGIMKDLISGGEKYTENDLLSKQSELDSLAEVKPLRFTADDVTPESLGIAMARNNEILAIVTAEGGLFDTLAGRFGDHTCIDLILKAYSGERWEVDRVTRDSEKMEHPYLTLLMMIQPITLEQIMHNPIFNQRGLTARFLISRPPSLVGKRISNPPDIDAFARNDYARFIETLVKNQNDGVIYLKFSQEARTVFSKFRDWLEPKLIDEYESFAEWCGKLAGNTARISGLLHIADMVAANTDDVEISADTVNRAISIGKYYIEQAYDLYEQHGLQAYTRQKHLKRVIRNLSSLLKGDYQNNPVIKKNDGGQYYITLRQLKKMMHVSDIHDQRDREAENYNITEDLNVLESHGYLTQAIKKSRNKKQSPILILNPDFINYVNAGSLGTNGTVLEESADDGFQIVDDSIETPFEQPETLDDFRKMVEKLCCPQCGDPLEDFGDIEWKFISATGEKYMCTCQVCGASFTERNIEIIAKNQRR